jgi:hypothetical protein
LINRKNQTKLIYYTSSFFHYKAKDEDINWLNFLFWGKVKCMTWPIWCILFCLYFFFIIIIDLFCLYFISIGYVFWWFFPYRKVLQIDYLSYVYLFSAFSSGKTYILNDKKQIITSMNVHSNISNIHTTFYELYLLNINLIF